MNWDHLSVQITAVLVALLAPGAFGVELLRRHRKKNGSIPREEADAAQAQAVLPESAQIVTVALTDRINALQVDFTQRLENERRERKSAEARWERRYARIWDWAHDLVKNWDTHRQQPTPPLLPLKEDA